MSTPGPPGEEPEPPGKGKGTRRKGENWPLIGSPLRLGQCLQTALARAEQLSLTCQPMPHPASPSTRGGNGELDWSRIPLDSPTRGSSDAPPPREAEPPPSRDIPPRTPSPRPEQRGRKRSWSSPALSRARPPARTMGDVRSSPAVSLSPARSPAPDPDPALAPAPLESVPSGRNASGRQEEVGGGRREKERGERLSRGKARRGLGRVPTFGLNPSGR